MNLSSARLRLTLWNVAVMAVVLLFVVTALRYTLEARLVADIDSRISNFAKFLAEPDTDGPPPRPFDDRGRPGPGPGPGPERPPGIGPGVLGREDGPPNPFRGGWRRRHLPRRPNDELPPAILDTRGFLLNGEETKGIIDQRGFDRALGGRVSIRSASIKGINARVCSVPIRRGGRIVGVVQIARSLTAVQAEIRHLLRTVLIISPFALLVAGLCGAFLTGRALRPVREFSAAATRIGANNLGSRLPVTGHDEFAQLATTFNGTLDRLQESFERLEESLEQQRRLTADASHELRTPLTVIKAHASLALSTKRTAAQYVETLTAIDQAADIMSRIVQDLLLLAQADAGQLTVQHDLVLLNEAAGMALDAASALEGPDIASVGFDDDIRVPGDVHLLARVFTNILSNAKRHTPISGDITLRASIESENVLVTVSDTGEGIPAEALPHIGERFYRVDNARSRSRGGTGLGLAICKTIIAAHGGELSISSTPGVGTHVNVRLPLISGTTSRP